MTSVLYERVKVDNAVNLYTAGGKKLLGKDGVKFEQLANVQW